MPARRWTAAPPVQRLAALRGLTAVELDLALCEQLGDAGVRALLDCPLSALLLWNTGDLAPATWSAVVRRFAPSARGLRLHDCYHRPW